jgi:hypothetical protein
VIDRGRRPFATETFITRSFSARPARARTPEVIDLAPGLTRLEQALDPDRVADPGDDLLVEERVADLAAGPDAAAADGVPAPFRSEGPSQAAQARVAAAATR